MKTAAKKSATPTPKPAPVPELEPIEPARTRVAIDIEIQYERLTAEKATPLEEVADDLQMWVVDVMKNHFDGAVLGSLRVFVIRSSEGPA